MLILHLTLYAILKKCEQQLDEFDIVRSHTYKGVRTDYCVLLKTIYATYWLHSLKHKYVDSFVNIFFISVRHCIVIVRTISWNTFDFIYDIKVQTCYTIINEPFVMFKTVFVKQCEIIICLLWINLSTSQHVVPAYCENDIDMALLRCVLLCFKNPRAFKSVFLKRLLVLHLL